MSNIPLNNSQFVNNNPSPMSSSSNSSLGQIQWSLDTSNTNNDNSPTASPHSTPIQIEDIDMSIGQESLYYDNDTDDPSNNLTILETLVDNNYSLSVNLVKFNKQLIAYSNEITEKDTKINLLEKDNNKLLENSNILETKLLLKNKYNKNLINKIDLLENKQKQSLDIIKNLTTSYNNAVTSKKYMNSTIINQLKNIKKKIQEKGINKSDKCKICYINNSNIATKPCGHVVMCQKCSDNLESYDTRCPLCREYILDTLKIYNNNSI